MNARSNDSLILLMDFLGRIWPVYPLIVKAMFELVYKYDYSYYFGYLGATLDPDYGKAYTKP